MITENSPRAMSNAPARRRPKGSYDLHILRKTHEGLLSLRSLRRTGDTNPSGLTANTEHSTDRNTVSAVLPIMNPLAKPVRPTVPITIRLVLSRFASGGSASSGSPWTK